MRSLFQLQNEYFPYFAIALVGREEVTERLNKVNEEMAAAANALVAEKNAIMEEQKKRNE